MPPIVSILGRSNSSSDEGLIFVTNLHLNKANDKSNNIRNENAKNCLWLLAKLTAVYITNKVNISGNKAKHNLIAFIPLSLNILMPSIAAYYYLVKSYQLRLLG